MNKKSKVAFVCNNCGQDYTKWHGKCDNCGSWDSITEIKVSSKNSRGFRLQDESGLQKPKYLSECSIDTAPRIKSGFSEIDRVLGGGMVRGAFILLGGDPGIGKSTLLLQLTARLAGLSQKVMYITGEESAEQVSMRARRLHCADAEVQILTETSVESILTVLKEHSPSIVVIDSIQTIFTEELDSAPGSVTQIRESSAMLLRHAKSTGTVVFLIGHVTKDGSIAGPRVLEHMVDTVLYFEGDSSYQYRIMRAVKNRFGPSGELALMTMADSGLKEISDTSEFFLANRNQPQIGTAVTPAVEGSRVLVIELQSLVNRSHFGLPQRVASGINPRKLALLLAVLERHGGIILGDHDVFFNIAGGLTIAEPSIDLAVAAAILSSFRNKPLRNDTAFIGELGLGGEIRPAANMTARLKELSRLGFKECIVPKPFKSADWFTANYNMKLITCDKISNLQNILF
ncbi:MAG: DNA repair protein RadA [Fibrobacter sp.]|nr:DNA repair protein RadA [Fibrobacter sp.]